MKKSERISAMLMALLLLLCAAGCGNVPEPTQVSSESPAASSEEQPAESSSEPESSSETEQESETESQGAAEPALWDVAYTDEESFKNCLLGSLEELSGMLEKGAPEERSGLTDAYRKGCALISAAETVAEAEEAYRNAALALLETVQTYSGAITLKSADPSVMNELLALLEESAVKNGTAGIPIFEDGRYVMFSARVVSGSETYLEGYGFGLLAEGSLNAEMESESEGAWKNYLHISVTEDPGDLAYPQTLSDVTESLYGYISTGYYTRFLNDAKDGYLLTPVLAKALPLSPETDENGRSVTWRVKVRTGEDGLCYRSGSALPYRAAFNGLPVAVEDYSYAFRLLLTQANGYAAGASLAAETEVALVGARAYYEGTAEGSSDALWEQVGVKTSIEDDGKYVIFSFTKPVTRMEAAEFLSSPLLMPVPREFIEQVSAEYYLKACPEKGESFIDNSLALGAYCPQYYEAGGEIIFVKNTKYVLSNEKYAIPGIRVDFCSEEKAFEAFLAGRLDAALVPFSALEEYRSDPRARRVSGSSVFTLKVNTAAGNGESGCALLQNTYFRKALSCAIDRESFASSRGFLPTDEVLAPGFLSAAEGVAYRVTAEHRANGFLNEEGTDAWGYSQEKARELFRVAMTELEAAGICQPGTPEAPTLITLTVLWMLPEQEERYHNELAFYWETAFNDPSVTGGKYLLTVAFRAAESTDAFYDSMTAGDYDIACGSVAAAGEEKNLLQYMKVFSSDEMLSGGYTLMPGAQTNDPVLCPVIYGGFRYSYDAFWAAVNGTALVMDGKNETLVSVSYEAGALEPLQDGSYAGFFTVRTALPDMTVLTVKDVICGNAERLYGGDGLYNETSLEYDTMRKDGSTVVTFVIPAELAARYRTGSGTSETAEGRLYLELQYEISLGNASPDRCTFGAEDRLPVIG